jgi:hypothetical protein
MAPKVIKTPLCQVVGPIVKHMAALAHAFQIAQAVPSRIVVHVRGGQDDAGRAETGGIDQVRPSARSALPSPPGLHFRVKPSSIRQAAHDKTMWAPADLAFALRPHETDEPAEFGPIGRIEVAKFPANGHGWNLVDGFRVGQHSQSSFTRRHQSPPARSLSAGAGSPAKRAGNGTWRLSISVGPRGSRSASACRATPLMAGPVASSRNVTWAAPVASSDMLPVGIHRGRA